MNKKGFTLVELLAIVVIISMLVIIVFPLITNSVNNYNKKTDELTISMIKEATKLYIDDNKNDFVKNSNNSYCIELNKLIDEEYLKQDIKLEGENITNTKSLQVTYTNSYNIELVDSKSCVEYRDICKPVTEETKTTGNIPKGNFAVGDEYICEVKAGTSYHFFVISVEQNRVNLILERNICSDGTYATSENNCTVEWMSGLDYGCEVVGDSCPINDKGPLTAISFLNKATSSWINIANLKEEYTDEGGRYGTIFLTGRARLPKKLELNMAGCDDDDMGTCPLWLVNYLYIEGGYENMISIDTLWGYWTLSSAENELNTAWNVICYGDLENRNIYSNENGIRPVISIPKTYLTN